MKNRGGTEGTSPYGSGWRDLNPRPLRPERSALPSCATARNHKKTYYTQQWNKQGGLGVWTCFVPGCLSPYKP